jgi:hypothetical protein
MEQQNDVFFELTGVENFSARRFSRRVRIVPGLVLMVAALGSGVMISEILAAG